MRYALAICCILFSVLLFGKTFDASPNHLDRESAIHSLNELSVQVDLPYTFETRRLLKIYTQTYRPGARRIIERSQLYFPQLNRNLEARGIPTILKNIGVLESNLEPWSVSIKGAVGIWQLMPYMARRNGLVMDNFVDERFDPILSSQVAFDYLEKLYSQFGNWNLAITAYNCGPSKMRKAMRLSRNDNLTNIAQYLPRESKKYISRLAAATYLTNHFEVHNIVPKTIKYKSPLVSIEVYKYVTFNDLSEITGLTGLDIAILNPAIFYDFLPTNNKGYHINLPLDEMLKFVLHRNRSISDIQGIHHHLNDIESHVAYLHSISFFAPFGLPREDLPLEKENDVQESAIAMRREQTMTLLALA